MSKCSDNTIPLTQPLIPSGALFGNHLHIYNCLTKLCCWIVLQTEVIDVCFCKEAFERDSKNHFCFLVVFVPIFRLSKLFLIDWL